MVDKDEELLKRLRETFAVEAEEHLGSISAGLLELEKAPVEARQRELIETVFREVHSLKGAARVVNMTAVVSLCQPLEDVFAALKRGNVSLSRDLFDLLHEAVEDLNKLLAESETTSATPRMSPTVQRLEAMAKGTGTPLISGIQRSAVRPTKTRGSRDSAPSVIQTPAAAPQAPAIEHKTAADTVRVASWKLDTLFRQAEEMLPAKLAAEQRVVELKEIVGMLLAHGKGLEALYTELSANSPGTAGPPPASIERKNNCNDPESLGLIRTQIADMRTLTHRLEAMTASAARDGRALGKMIDGLLEDARRLLMLPVSVLIEPLHKLVRDLAREQNKEVALTVEGGDIEIDRRIQEAMKDPLIHILRNCIDHGIETPAERRRCNKPKGGTIVITIAQKTTGRAEITISDDGRGIDPGKVLATARKLDVVSAEEAQKLNEQEILSLIFRSGVSTSPIVTDISGRGLGLSIVQEKVESLGGSITVESRGGKRTLFRITLPLMLAAYRGVMVRAGGQRFILPTINMERVVRIRREDIKTIENKAAVRLNGHAISLVNLRDALRLPAAGRGEHPDLESVVIVAFGGEHIAFVVDEVQQELEVVLKGFGSQLSRVRNVAGATITGTGTLVPILNVADLMKSAAEVEAVPRPAERVSAAEERMKSVLVVEDSITARSLLKNILETAGYQVKTAVDGLDAFTRLRVDKFDLVVSDVEMPRMNGFDLTAKIRAEKTLTDLPVVLVTALASREDRERGIDVGANAYIVKSSFDQSGLLDIVRRLA
ncbi:MAG TPA: response regulator [Gammaproteobacteria bacterium]|nr:response regulator [Gammaproteobacteria bacterium]